MDRLHSDLGSTFGFSSFRAGQEPVMRALLAGRPALAVFPTGGGKSLCYQLPALQLPGLTLVISPLLALMKDQVDHLLSLGVAAARLDSTLTAAEARDLYSRMENGSLKLLYVAPERLVNEGFRRRLARTSIAMLAIDEAHCISAWGHNFRPDYLKIAAFARELGVQRVLALTATATPEVASDIRAAFDIAASDHVQTGFHRPNLVLRVHRCTPQTRLPTLIERLHAQGGGATIVYVTLQKTAERVAARLTEAGLQARAYHAGMRNDARAALQEDFMNDRVRIVVATIAFGMGIDKADIRAVYHYNLPKSLESYSQEIGRAGRDGQTSRCELLACAQDQIVLDNFSYGDTPTQSALLGLMRELEAGGERFDVSKYRLSRGHDIRPLVVSTVLTYLELDGILVSTGPFYAGYKVAFERDRRQILSRFAGERRAFVEGVFASGKMGRTWLSLDLEAAASALDQPRDRIITALNWLEQQGDLRIKPSDLRHGFRRGRSFQVDAVVADLAERFEGREQADLARTRQVLSFAETDACLTGALVGYFGESLDGPCGHCGPCAGDVGGPLPRPEPAAPTPAQVEAVRALAQRSPPELSDPRALARFVCGLTSPATGGRGGLQHREPTFGIWSDQPFLGVLERCAELTPR